MKRFRRCPPEGTLRLLVDTPGETAIRQHVAGCRSCQQRLERLRADAEFVERALTALEQSLVPLPVGATESRKERPMRYFRKASAALAVTLALALVVWLAPVGALADQLVQRFRVQQFAAITIPASTISSLSDQFGSVPEEQRAALSEQLQRSFQVTPEQMDGEHVREVDSLDALTAHLGRAPLVPAAVPAPFASIQPRYLAGDPQRSEMTIDVASVQEAAAQLGLQFASLPDPSVTPTVTVALSVPASAAQVWEAGDRAMLLVAELESPTLELPAEIDPELLREDLLMLPGLPPDVVAQIRAVRDWRQTLIIPIPEEATSRTISLRGTSGLLIEGSEGSAVLWQERGILYVVGGSVTADQALAIARSLR